MSCWLFQSCNNTGKLSERICILLLCVEERQKGLWQETRVATGKKQAEVWGGDQVICPQNTSASCKATSVSTFTGTGQLCLKWDSPWKVTPSLLVFKAVRKRYQRAVSANTLLLNLLAGRWETLQLREDFYAEEWRMPCHNVLPLLSVRATWTAGEDCVREANLCPRPGQAGVFLLSVVLHDSQASAVSDPSLVWIFITLLAVFSRWRLKHRKSVICLSGVDHHL